MIEMKPLKQALKFNITYYSKWDTTRRGTMASIPRINPQGVQKNFPYDRLMAGMKCGVPGGLPRFALEMQYNNYNDRRGVEISFTKGGLNDISAPSS
jgi:hypothetical protein